MERFCVYGVVRNGQVVLDVPLSLPDGAVVVVTDRAPADVGTVGPIDPPPEEVVKGIILDLARRPDLTDDPDWEQKIRRRCG